MTLKDLNLNNYVCPTAPISCQFQGLRFKTDEPLRQLCSLSDGDTVMDIVFAVGARIAPGLRVGEHISATVGIRMMKQWARVEVLALDRAVAQVRGAARVGDARRASTQALRVGHLS